MSTRIDIGHHISEQYNEELEDVRNRVLTMGGLIEQQIEDALLALENLDGDLAEQVISVDHRVNAMEVAIDEECSRIIARRQPTASDLRLLVTVIKTITDLERIGDEAEKIGHLASALSDMEGPYYVQHDEVQFLGSEVSKMLHETLDAFARLSVKDATRVAHMDDKIDRQYENILRQIITYMMEDPRTITRSLNVMWCARALERIGDHAKNICEYVIYMVEGKDVRHTSFPAYDSGSENTDND